jgi:hypothetical protein
MLGRLTKIDLRNAWKNEEADFTPWLSEDENINLISDAIGIEITNVQTEVKAGNFETDILAEEVQKGRKIVIENQLESTNHAHLGKLLSYAAVHDAAYVIWIVKDARDEHRQAIDWLNDHTDEHLNFFLLKIELWQIGNSKYAPKFEVISRPNDWVKRKRQESKTHELSELKRLQLEFWTKFRENAHNSKTNLRLRKPYPQHWYDISYGNSRSRISLTITTRPPLVGCEIYIDNSKELFHQLFAHKDDIENELNQSLDLREIPVKKASRIVLRQEGKLHEKGKWEDYFQWMLTCAEQFNEVFSKYAI